jgi:AmiR/NasT family two-component response regulator
MQTSTPSADRTRAVRDLMERVVLQQQEIEQLRNALGNARAIGCAIGVVMATLKLTDHQAFDLLARASQDSNRKLRAIADDVVTTGLVPHHPVDPS